MVRISLCKFGGSLLVAVGCLTGCDDRTPATDAATNGVVAVDGSEGALADEPTDPEVRAARDMRDLLDGGDELGALRAARNLMDSTNREVRAEVVGVFAWIGRSALPELTELANDETEDIRQSAMDGIEQALGEISGDNLKVLEVEKVLTGLKRTDQFESVFMALSGIDEAVALRFLARLITKNAGKPVAEAARDFYTHLSGGEIFDSVEATEKFIKEEKGSQK